jgi:hypothetical protein
MIQGVVTTSDVLLHASLIVRSFGVHAFMQCVWAVVRRRRTTFLELMWAA